eukprot:NODE_16_length_41655_cov_0.272813.p17 type:complete len:236 gc:universal NODE_16_length_41655_cov_0.272813:27837-27130(-)
MLIPSHENLTNPCLPDFFTEYTGFSSVFAILGILLTHFVQIMVSKVMTDKVALPKHNCSPKGTEKFPNCGHGVRGEGISRLTICLLELGIATHSVIVGLTLGVTVNEFEILLIALGFHQFFEGIALSAIVTDAKISGGLFSALMVCFYSLATPFGMCIGVAVHEWYSENSVATLIAIGILEGLSCGILLYDGLLNIIGPHFQNDSFKTISTAKQMGQIIAFWSGSAAMAVIGKWA